MDGDGVDVDEDAPCECAAPTITQIAAVGAPLSVYMHESVVCAWRGSRASCVWVRVSCSSSGMMTYFRFYTKSKNSSPQTGLVQIYSPVNMYMSATIGSSHVQRRVLRSPACDKRASISNGQIIHGPHATLTSQCNPTPLPAACITYH